MCDYTVEVPRDVINQDPRMDYNFQLMGSFRDPLSRQLEECVRIAIVHNDGKVLVDRRPGRTEILNKKDEHCQPRVVLPSFGSLGNLLQG